MILFSNLCQSTRIIVVYHVEEFRDRRGGVERQFGSMFGIKLYDLSYLLSSIYARFYRHRLVSVESRDWECLKEFNVVVLYQRGEE